MLVLFAAGCEDQTNPDPVSPQAQTSEIAARVSDVVEVLKSYGGGSYLYDRTGARRSVAAAKAAQDFKTMINWKHSARAHFGLPGFHTLGYSEDRNEIVGVVDDERDRDALIEAFRTIGIPDGRFTVKTGPRAVSTATVEDRYRPVVGGLKIVRPAEDSDVTGVPCTLGYNAYGGAGNHGGFVTNSHCTPDPGSQYDTVAFFQQDTLTSSDSIGVQLVDPPGFSCSESSDHLCRYSDAAFFEYVDGVNWKHGYLANINESAASCEIDNSADDKTIDSSTPHAEITVATRPQDAPAKGDTVIHLGITNGQTEAEVLETNYDKFSNTMDMLLLDQSQSGCDGCIISGPGDSGGPVYRFDSTGLCGSKVKLDGIRWGTSAFEGGWDVWWSPVENVDKDMGSYLDIVP